MGSEGSMSGKEWNEQYLSEPSWEVSAPPPFVFRGLFSTGRLPTHSEVQAAFTHHSLPQHIIL